MSHPPSPDPFALLSRPEVSSSREQLVEYLILSELLQDSWLRRREFIEVLRADVDAAGYDLLLECGRVARHVQLKSSVVGGKTKKQKVHTALAQKPSGCVLWAVLSPGLANRIQLEYLVFGGKPGAPLPTLDGFPVALHPKRNAQGVRTPRPGIREVEKKYFTQFASVAELSDWLFGPPQAAAPLLPLPLPVDEDEDE